MAANLGLVLLAVASPFVLFITVLAYGAWMTHGLQLTTTLRTPAE